MVPYQDTQSCRRHQTVWPLKVFRITHTKDTLYHKVGEVPCNEDSNRLSKYFVRGWATEASFFPAHIWAGNRYENATGTRLFDHSPRRGERARTLRGLGDRNAGRSRCSHCHRICLFPRWLCLLEALSYRDALTSHSLLWGVCCPQIWNDNILRNKY